MGSWFRRWVFLPFPCLLFSQKQCASHALLVPALKEGPHNLQVLANAPRQVVFDEPSENAAKKLVHNQLLGVDEVWVHQVQT